VAKDVSPEDTSSTCGTENMTKDKESGSGIGEEESWRSFQQESQREKML